MQWLKYALIASLGSLAIGAQTAHANTLRWAFAGDMLTLDPHAHAESFTFSMQLHFYEGLVRYNEDLDVEPALATSWELVSPKVWRFKLREGVKFHNGSPFNADDVVASFERLLGPDVRFPTYVRAVKGVRKIDDYTVEFDLHGPYPLLLKDFTAVYILDAEWMTEHDALKPGNNATGETTYASTHANGTGPFRVESFQPDSKTVMVVNPEWWDTPKHNITRIEFLPIRSDATRVAALLSGELDMMYPAPLQDIARIDAADGFRVVESPTLRTIYLGLNFRPELHRSDIKGANPLLDVRVRKALYQGINLDLIQTKIMRGKARVASLIVAPEIPGYDPEIKRYPYDPDTAKSLLVEAGYPNGFRVGLDCPNDRYVNDEEVCVAIAAMWSRIGVNVDLVTQTKANHFPKLYRGETDIYMMGWATMPTIDTYDALASLLATPSGALGGNNGGAYSNPRIDEIVAQSAVELNEEKRLGLLREGLVISNEDVAVIPLFQQPQSWAIRDGVTIPQSPDEYVRMWWATID